MAEKIMIANAIKTRCSKCHTTLMLSNETERLFCNTVIIYSAHDKPGHVEAKCKECKTMNMIKVS